MAAQGLQAGAAVLNARPVAAGVFLAVALAGVRAASGPPAEAAGPAASAAARGWPAVEVHAPTPCLSCIDWADHLRRQGFQVTLSDVPLAEMPRLKRRLKVPQDLESVLTARVGPYFLEGPVPAQDVIELLRERPKARGLAVPGTPRGAPGLETYNPVCDTACTILDNAEREPEVRREVFQTLLVLPDGRTRIWARH